MGWTAFRKRSQREAWKRHLLKRQRRICPLCGCRFPTEADGPNLFVRGYWPTFDHIVPKSLGGPDRIENLQLVHGTCNKKKGNTLADTVPISMPRVLRVPPNARGLS
jgi:5-methylcytosine-specific restriction endonuclease McrA